MSVIFHAIWAMALAMELWTLDTSTSTYAIRQYLVGVMVLVSVRQSACFFFTFIGESAATANNGQRAQKTCNFFVVVIRFRQD